MTQEQFNRERNYSALRALSWELLARGMIDTKEFAQLRCRLLEQYAPPVSGLRRGGDTP
jgi:hypothetical protein